MLNACGAVDDPRASAANDYAMRRVNLLFSSLFRVVFDMRVIPAGLLKLLQFSSCAVLPLQLTSVLYLDDLES